MFLVSTTIISANAMPRFSYATPCSLTPRSRS